VHNWTTKGSERERKRKEHWKCVLLSNWMMYVHNMNFWLLIWVIYINTLGKYCVIFVILKYLLLIGDQTKMFRSFEFSYHEVEVEVKLRLTISRPVYLEPMTRFLFSVWQLRVSCCGRPLWREDMSVIYSYNCSWAFPEQSLWGPSPSELRPYFTLIWDSPNLEGQVPIFISSRNRVAQLYPRSLGSLFVASYDSELRWRYSNPPPHRYLSNHALLQRIFIVLNYSPTWR
jgi:hypothetical protein